MKKIYLLSVLLIVFSIVKAQLVIDGIKMIQYQRYTSAINAFKSILDVKPDNSEAMFWLGQAYILNKQPDSAISIFKKKSANDYSDVFRVALEQALFAKNQKEGDIPIVVKSPSVSIASPLLLLAIGKYFEQKAQFKRALPYYHKLSMTQPETMFNRLMYSKVLIKSGDGAEGYKQYMAILQSDSNYAPAYFGLARLFKTSPSVFMPYLHKAVEKDSSFAPAWYELFRHAYYNDKANAQKYYYKYLQNTDKDSKQSFQLIANAYDAKNYKQVIKLTEEALKDEDTDLPIKAYKYLSYSYYMNNNIVKAFDNAVKYLQVQDSVDITAYDYYLAAQFALRQKKFDSTAAYYVSKGYLYDTSTSNRALYSKKLVNYYSDKKDIYNTNIWKTAFVSLEGNQMNGLFDVGVAWLDYGDYKKADSLFSIYNTLYPNEPTGLFIKAILQAQNDKGYQTGVAVPYFKEYLSVVGGDVNQDNRENVGNTYQYLGAYYYANKDYQQAYRYYSLLQKLNPSDKAVRQTVLGLKKYLAARK